MGEEFYENRNSFESFKDNELLSKKIIKIAHFESELELGVNPTDLEQANTAYLSELDFEYIRKICAIVEKKLTDSNWLAKTLINIDNDVAARRNSIRGIRFDDELFKIGRGILENFLIEKYKEKL